MKYFERFLVKLDSGPWSAIFRVVLGLCLPPAFRAISWGGDQVWTSLVLFVGLLIALRLVPAVLRQGLRFSVEAKTIWFERRQIAKRYDSYQWQKLFWVGVGMLPYAVVGGGLRAGEQVLLLICLLGGGAGLLIWRKINAVPPTKNSAPSVDRKRHAAAVT